MEVYGGGNTRIRAANGDLWLGRHIHRTKKEIASRMVRKPSPTTLCFVTRPGTFGALAVTQRPARESRHGRIFLRQNLSAIHRLFLDEPHSRLRPPPRRIVSLVWPKR